MKKEAELQELIKDKKLELLKSWQEVSKQYTEAISAYIDVTHCTGEAPHIKTADNVHDKFTKLIAEATGIPFDELICWAYDLQYGEVAALDFKVDGEWRSARTIEELFFIWDDLNKEVNGK